MSSDFRVPVTQIKAINKHPNPKVERLEVATVFDFNVIVRKGQYKVGDTVIYVPIDSLLPGLLEATIFGPDSKIKLNNSRVRQIRIQGFPSQGMLIPPKSLGLGELEEGQDLSEKLGITKYEPHVPDFQANGPKTKKERNKVWENPYFHQYNGLANFKYYSDTFVEGQEVVYEAKIHGTNARAAKLPYTPKTLWQRFIKWIGRAPEYQFCYGSNSVQLQAKSYTGFYTDNVYAEACKQYDIQNKIKPNETVYFEIYGQSIQKGYMYDCQEGERKIVVFDVKILADDKQSTRWLSVDERHAWCKERGLPEVPELFRGPHYKDLAKSHTLGNCMGGQKIREGIVIRDPNETVCYYGKKFLKLLSEKYLDQNNSDFH
jgi:RNA ligase (TIGR02306 family)